MANPNKFNSRQYIMSRITSNNTKPEMIVRRFLHSKGIRYSLHSKNLAGKPDLYLSKFSLAIEIRGCFWHGHENCKFFIIPKTNTDWWIKKIQATKHRDYINEIKLLSQGIETIVVWECSLKGNLKSSNLDLLYEKIIERLK
ncbi:very short patch repair endonuclease [Chryseobacterium sp.]|uniref:very short patch repair endonuclease n=1 Tax=Chryseobacterium sp. TaxID=1871047 RepID=UPI00289B7CC2|nr:very short patch repair endonuclease [Chryseobacterium sp.]